MMNQKKSPIRALNTRGYAISLDILFSVILLSGALLFFASQPFTQSQSAQTLLRADTAAQDTLDALDGSGFFSRQLVDRKFDQGSVTTIYERARLLLPKNTQMHLRITQYELPEDMANCRLTQSFEECFENVPSETFEAGVSLQDAVSSGVNIAAGKKTFAKHEPAAEISEQDPSSCQILPSGDLAKKKARPVMLRLQTEPPHMDFNSTVTSGLTQGRMICDQPAHFQIQVRNEARDPVAVMLVMDRSQSMDQFDMVARSTKGVTLTGGTCRANPPQLLDLSGHNNNATDYNVTIAPIRDNQGGLAGTFLAGSFLETPDSSGLHVDSFTFSAWIYPTTLASCGTGSGTCVIFNKEGEYAWSLDNQGTLYFSINNTNPGWVFQATSIKVDLGVWNHLVLTHQANSGINAYKNVGTQWSYGAAPNGLILDSANSLRFGARGSPGLPNSFFSGYLDDVRIYNSAFSLTEIGQLFLHQNPQPGNLVLKYDFEDLADGPVVGCTHSQITAPGASTNCVKPTGAGDGGIMASYTGVTGNVATFSVDSGLVSNFEPTGVLGVSLYSGGPSGICSSDSSWESWRKPPFMRVKRPSGYFNYYGSTNAGLGTAALNADVATYGNPVTYEVQMWNSDNNAYAAAPSLSVYYDSGQIPLTNPVPTVPASGPFFVEANSGTVSTDQAIFGGSFETTTQPGECDYFESYLWEPVGSFDLQSPAVHSDQTVYRLDFNVGYNASANQCRPHIRVIGPPGSGIDRVFTTCPFTGGCLGNAWDSLRGGGSYAPTGNYQVLMRSDTALASIKTDFYYNQYLADAPNVSDPYRRCELAGNWTEIGSYNLPAWADKIYFNEVRTVYSGYASGTCLPELKVERTSSPGQSWTWNSCSTFDCNVMPQYYSGYALHPSSYKVFMRTTDDITFSASPSPYARYVQWINQSLKTLGKSFGDPDFVGGGTCDNGPCAYGITGYAHTESSCPNVKVSFVDANSFSSAEGTANADGFSITDNIQGLRVVTKAAIGGTPNAIPVCTRITGFKNPVSGSLDLSTRMPTFGIGQFGINYSPAGAYNISSPIPLPNGDYNILGWVDGTRTTIYDVNWYYMRLDHAKKAAKLFLDGLSWQAQDRLGLVDFGTDVQETVPLTANVEDVKAGIDSLVPNGITATGDALQLAVDQVRQEQTPNKFVILLSDGKQNAGSAVPQTVAYNAFHTDNIVIYAIGFGSDVDESELASIASNGGGSYYYADNAEDLLEAFQQIAISVQETIQSADVHIRIPPGVEYSNVLCRKSDQSGYCTDDETEPTCECASIQNDLDDNNYLTFYSAKILKARPNWWTAEFDVTVPCNGAYCDVNSLSIPPVGSYVHTVKNNNGADVDWPDGNRTTVGVDYRDLGISVVSGNIDPVTRKVTAILDVKNLGQVNQLLYDSGNGKYTQDGCNGISVRMYQDDLDHPLPVAPFCSTPEFSGNPPDGLCSQPDCPSAEGWEQSFRVEVSDLSEGYLFAVIDPALTAPEPIRECSLHNFAALVCLGDPKTDFFVIEYWAWTG